MMESSSATPHEPVSFYDSLPRKLIAAAILLFNVEGQVLLVEPTYKPHWDLPGGVVEADESPRAAAHREIAEELSLHCVPGRLLVLDWVQHISKMATQLPD
ncbi:MAG: NUDIX domain-containing protein [Pseudonocardiaceae bacterium]